MLHLTDRVSVSASRRTSDGYLVADAKVARTGVQHYLGSEVGRPEMPIVRVYRPAEEVFAADAMHSYAYRPVTDDHPAGPVTADSWREHARGQTGGEVVRDGEFVRVPLVLMDAASIKKYEAGKREASMGYSCDLEFVAGVTDSGEQYDAVQRNLRMNHLALVDRARGGDQLRIGDDNPTRETTMSDTKTRTIMVDGLSVETTDAGAQAIDKLQRQLADAATTQANQAADHERAIAAKDAELAARDATIDDLKGKVLSDADIDKRVAERSALVDRARVIKEQDYSGKSAAQIRQAAVAAVLGDAAIEGKHEAYVEARFDHLYDAAKANGNQDPVRNMLRDGGNRQVANDNGYAASVAALNAGPKAANGGDQ